MTRGYRLEEADAEDVFQEVFARTYEHLDRLYDGDALRPGAPVPRAKDADLLLAGYRVVTPRAATRR